MWSIGGGSVGDLLPTTDWFKQLSAKLKTAAEVGVFFLSLTMDI
jgi:hypothetical protein